jgi:hypothetical protein
MNGILFHLLLTAEDESGSDTHVSEESRTSIVYKQFISNQFQFSHNERHSTVNLRHLQCVSFVDFEQKS